MLEVNAPDYRQTSVASTVIFEYNNSWELCVDFTPIYVTNQVGCIIGTDSEYCYYDNPSLELRTSGSEYTGCWFGFTNNNQSWTYGKDVTFDESLVLNEEYTLKIGVNEDGHAYVTLTRVSAGTVILNHLSTETVSQVNTYQRRLALGSNARNPRFTGIANFNLAKCYYKENGVTLWGVIPSH